jgi:hypothetical protein
MAHGDNGKPLVNTARLYDLQGVINVADFDFDGHADFAVQNGNDGPYGGPTYSVYLYDNASKQFVLSDELSTLTSETLGMFQVDAKRKRLRTLPRVAAVTTKPPTTSLMPATACRRWKS